MADNFDGNNVDSSVVTARHGSNRNVSHRQYIRYNLNPIYFYLSKKIRYLMAERGDKATPHWLWDSGKLAEAYVIDVVNRIERHEIDNVKKAYEDKRITLSADLKAALEKGLNEGETIGKVFFMPITFKGSRKYMQKGYANLMTIARTFGNPTWYN